MDNSAAAKSARYRAKDVEGYRKRKAEYARTPKQREIRTAYMRVWRANNRAKHNEQARQSHLRNKDKPENILYRRNYNLKKYGMTVTEYERMWGQQKGLCGICLAPPPSARKFHVDHCHKTGKVRKLLCSRCNGALGWFEKYRNSIVSYADTMW